MASTLFTADGGMPFGDSLKEYDSSDMTRANTRAHQLDEQKHAREAMKYLS